MCVTHVNSGLGTTGILALLAAVAAVVIIIVVVAAVLLSFFRAFRFDFSTHVGRRHVPAHNSKPHPNPAHSVKPYYGNAVCLYMHVEFLIFCTPR